MPKTISTFGELPTIGYVRQSQLISNTKRSNKPGVLPFSSATLWRMVNAGLFPRPVKLSERVTAWKVEDVRAWMQAKEASQ